MHTNIKIFYPIRVIDLRFQVDHITPEKFQLFEDWRAAAKSARLFGMLLKHRQIYVIPDGHKITQVQIKKNDKTLFKRFHAKIKFTNETMNERYLQRVYKYPIHPRDSKIFPTKIFVKVDKMINQYFVDTFGGQPDKSLLQRSPKPLIFHNYKIPDSISSLISTYCLYLFYLMERMDYYDAILEMTFG